MQRQFFEQKAPSSFRQSEIFIRMNYLHQAAHLAVSLGYEADALGTDAAAHPDVQAACQAKQLAACSTMGRFYTSTMRRIAARLVVRQDPAVKRTYCKRCSSVLLAGASAKVRVHGRRLHVTCTTCGLVQRRFLAPL